MEAAAPLPLSIEKISSWDLQFFTRFIAIRCNLYCDHKEFLPESIDDFAKLYSNDSPFHSALEWEAVIIKQDGKDTARILYTYNKEAKNQIINCGYLECEDELNIAKELFKQAEQFARKHNCTTLKGPIQGTFFNSYRYKTSGNNPLFYSEPIHKNYYIDLFLQNGFHESNRWDTRKLNIIKTWENFKQIRKTIPKRNKNSFKLKVRPVRTRNWNKDLEAVYHLFMRSYSYMPEFEPISLECFKLLYDDFKYILNPLAAYLIEYENEPVGFNINFFDPLPILRQAYRQSKRFNWKWWKILIKLYTLIRLKLNFKKLLIMYVGKVPTKDGQEIKGIQALTSRRIFLIWKILRCKEMLVCFSATNSPNKKSFRNDDADLYSTYAVYSKKVSLSDRD